MKKKIRAGREKGEITNIGKWMRITPNFSIETKKARKSWEDVLQTLKYHRCKQKYVYPGHLSITVNVGKNIFHE